MDNIINKYENESTFKSISALLKKDKTVFDGTSDNCFKVGLNITVHSSDSLKWNGTSLVALSNVSLSFGKKTYILTEGSFWSPFTLLSNVKFKGNFMYAITYLMGKYGEDTGFIRVGDKYFKLFKETNSHSSTVETQLVGWAKQTILDDYGKEIFVRIPKFTKFTNSPSHLDYISSGNGMYNVYNEVKHGSKEFDVTGDLSEIRHTISIIKHLFGDTWKLGIEYFKVLWMLPKQRLPIVVFGSEEQNTGKSTFNEYLRMLFGYNTTTTSVDGMQSKFNASIANKLIVCIEETKSDNLQLVEKLKWYSTARILPVEEKYQSIYDSPFYAKFVILTNHPKKFLIIEKQDSRFWVNRVSSLNGEADDDIYEKLRKEIPNFLHYIETLETKGSRPGARFYFDVEEYRTDALDDVIENTKNALQSDLEMILDEFGSNNIGLETIEFTCTDFKNNFMRYEKHSLKRLSSIFRDDMGLEMKKTAYNYTNFNMEDKRGKFFSFKNPHFSGQRGQTEEEIPF